MKSTNLALMLGFLLLYGCEKRIDFELNEEVPKLVVEASIENGEPPRVTLMKSIGYFSSVDLGQVANSFVHNAEVYVSNGTLTHRLKEYSIPVTPNLSVSYYSIDSSSLATAFEGELNGSYTLRVVAEGKEYTAATTIPDTTKTIDSIWWKPAPATSDTLKTVVMVRVTDAPGFGDYIRYFTRINRQPVYLPPYNSVFDDLFIDGTSYEVQLQQGTDRITDTVDNDFFMRGDTIDVKLSSIDRATFDFWRTWEFSFSSIGNPFSSPIRILGNISNGALGYFAGYGSQYRRLIIPH
jgi:hypothetical protein